MNPLPEIQINRKFAWTCLAGTAVVIAAASASAESIRITGPSMFLELEGGSMPGTLGSGVEIFDTSDLEFMQQELQADGIDTQGRVSIFLAETANGWSVVSLFDGNGSGNPLGNNSTIGFTSSTSDVADHHWNTDNGGEMNWWDLGNQTQLVDGTFEWETGATSAGFAWSDMESGMSGTATYIDLGLDQLVPQGMFQFLRWGGNQWEVDHTADFQDASDTLALAFKVIPTPGALGLLGLAGLGSRRRRRR